MMTTGTVVLIMSADDETADRRALLDGSTWPDGIRVILEVGDRYFANPWTVSLLQEHGAGVHYDVHGSSRAVSAWLSALRKPAIERGRC